MDGHVCCFILTVLEPKWHWKFRARFNSEESSLEVWHDRSGITSQAYIQRGTQAPAWLSGHIQTPSSHRAKLNKRIPVALSCTWRIPVSRHAFHLEEAQDTHAPTSKFKRCALRRSETQHTHHHTLTRCNLSTCVNRAKTRPPKRSTRFVLQDGDCQEQILPQRAMVNDQPTRLTTTSLLQMALRFLSTKTVDPRGPALSGSLVLFSFVVLWLFGSFLRYKKYKDIFRPESPIWQWITYTRRDECVEHHSLDVSTAAPATFGIETMSFVATNKLSNSFSPKLFNEGQTRVGITTPGGVVSHPPYHKGMLDQLHGMASSPVWPASIPYYRRNFWKHLVFFDAALSC